MAEEVGLRIAIGSDRRGFACKEKLIGHIIELGYEAVDVGPYDGELPVDYPIYGEKVGRLVARGDCDFGAVVCATGIGIMIAANKVDGVRCGMAYADDVAQLMREHNDANVIAFGQDHMRYSDIERRLDIFLGTSFLGGYHVARVQQLADIEKGMPITQSPFLDKSLGSNGGEK